MPCLVSPNPKMTTAADPLADRTLDPLANMHAAYAQSMERKRQGSGGAWGSMESAMGIFSRFKPSISGDKRSQSRAESRAIADLADLVGRKEAFIGRLYRHADQCAYPAMAAQIRWLADKQAEHFKTLRAILVDRGAWPRPPADQPREGSNNWERLSGDLAILSAYASGLRRCAIEWEALDREVADTLAQVAAEDVDHESDLRQLALKCDPQALD